MCLEPSKTILLKIDSIVNSISLEIEFPKETKYRKITEARREEASHPGAQSNSIAEQAEPRSYDMPPVYYTEL